MENIAKAILSVMEQVKGIDRSMKIGTGDGAYMGVPDKEVKKIIGDAMRKNGLCLIPINIEPKCEVSRWTDERGKQKQSIFTEVKTKYLLLHSSGESIELTGYGHGVDSQDKSAGKATTYALKYAMLYTFLVPTGTIDDTDNTHSKDIVTPANNILQQWQDALSDIASLDELSAFYRQNREAVESEKDIKALLTKRKLELTKTKKS